MSPTKEINFKASFPINTHYSHYLSKLTFLLTLLKLKYFKLFKGNFLFSLRFYFISLTAIPGIIFQIRLLSTLILPFQNLIPQSFSKEEFLFYFSFFSTPKGLFEVLAQEESRGDSRQCSDAFLWVSTLQVERNPQVVLQLWEWVSMGMPIPVLRSALKNSFPVIHSLCKKHTSVLCSFHILLLQYEFSVIQITCSVLFLLTKKLKM